MKNKVWEIKIETLNKLICWTLVYFNRTDRWKSWVLITVNNYSKVIINDFNSCFMSKICQLI